MPPKLWSNRWYYLSKNQADWANKRILDWESVTSAGGVEDVRSIKDTKFDKISSVEMLHHIGYNSLPEYFQTIKDLLKPGGLSFQLGVTNNAAKGV
ncbi:hypothetical protein MASR2M39_28190 [Ignavibacteriales bacterium]